ncbi:hypothetical protein F0562_021229 [Nyssa sinensis]|uniref:Uncharacterized protein n=1 Tax=Nyssa sinensis TaxID=561372 RepID=A0A5J5BKV7_9ASTE|nr:hypothetical protein F0562_021229 [Nyssa sinensis]
MSIKDMQDEIFSLKETKGKLEVELELRVDQRNALQQEIYCLKEELNELNKKHGTILEQVDAVGFSAECFQSSVKKLQDENSNLKENCQRERSERVALLEKLEIMEQLLEKNALLENSLSGLSVELEGVRGKIKVLEESCQSLLEEKATLVDEKATLITQLQVTTENLEKLSERNMFLENSLSDAHDELEGMKAKSESLEDSCQLLNTEKSGLINENDILVSQLQITRKRLEDLEKRCTELEEKYSCLEKEKESTVCEVKELHASLDVEKQERASLTQLSETQLAVMETQIHLLQEEVLLRKREFEEGLDKAMDSQIETFIMERCVRDLEEKNNSLLIECQKLLEASKLSEKLISELEHENLEQQVELKSLFDQTSILRRGVYQLVKALGIVLDHGCEDKIGQDQKYLNHVLGKLEDTKCSLGKTQDENRQLVVEMSVLVTLLGQLRLEAANLEMERNTVDQEFRNLVNEKSVELKKLGEDLDELHGINGALEEKLRLMEGTLEEIQLENFHLKETLQKSEDQLKRVTFVNDQLNCEVENGKGLLRQKEMEFLDAEQKVVVTENKKSELHKIVEDLKRELDEVKMFREDQGKQIFKLSEYNDYLTKENGGLCEANHKLEFEIYQLREEHEKKKVHEFTEAYGRLEDQSTSKDTDIELLKERVCTLEDENGGLKAQLGRYVPSVLSLRDSISSLEKHSCLLTKLQKTDNEEAKDAEGQNAMMPDAFSDLQDLQIRVIAIEKSVIEMERNVMQENLNGNAKLEAAMRQIEELKSESSSHQENIEPTFETSEVENLTKDILPDQAKKEDAASTEKDIEQKSACPTSEMLVEKELRVDKLEISKRSMEPHHEVNGRKILERLNSDVQKLTNLQITVQDLKRKVEISEKSTKGKAIVEFETVKGQLEEAEVAILKLSDLNGTLMKNIEDNSFSTDGKSAMESEESGTVRRKRSSEQARRMSEKIGQLQLEVQKIQFVLLKLDDEKESKGRARIPETTRRTVLRDYLYGGVRTGHRRKKVPFCACVQPPTTGRLSHSGI